MKNYNFISDKCVFELITKTRTIGLLIETSIPRKGKNVCHFKCKTNLNDLNYDGWWWAKFELDTLSLRIIAGNKSTKQNLSFYLPIISFENSNDIMEVEFYAS